MANKWIIQIGGSLAKVVYFTREPNEQGGRLNFINFETDRIDSCIEFMAELKVKQQTLSGSEPNELCVMATGGGSYKYYDKIKKALGVEVWREDEMECLIVGQCLNIFGSQNWRAFLADKRKGWIFS